MFDDKDELGEIYVNHVFVRIVCRSILGVN